MLLKAQTAILTAIVAAATVLPASAQGFTAEEVQRLNDMQKRMPNIGRAYGIRVTTGASTNAGFERPLVNSDPNLKHWCWIPVTNYNQAYLRKAPGQTGAKGTQTAYKRPASVYVKPTRVALPTVDHGAPQRVVARSFDNGRSTSNVSAKVSFSKQPATAYTAETKTYSGSYSDVSGRLSAPRYTAAFNSSRDVYGKIVSRTTTH